MKILVGTSCKTEGQRDGETERRRDRKINDRISPSLRLSVPLSLCLSLFLSACGKIGDPLPPIPRAPLIIDELTVAQQGTQLVLTFPIVRTPRSAKLQRVDIYRLIEPGDGPPGLTQESFSTRATIIASIEGDEIPLNRSIITHEDSLDVKSAIRNSRYRYAVRLVTTGGVAADFSNYAIITPLFDLALPPTSLQAKQSENLIEITWSAPAENVSGTTPANIAAYNIYRRLADSKEPPVKLNASPLQELRFVDRGFQFGTNYEYIVRGLSLLPGNASLASAIECDASPPLIYTPKDTFPPGAPQSVTIASINGIVSLFWPLNTEPDVVGYNIYRADDDKTPPDKWVKLNLQLHKTASFRDERVQVGKQYFYQITAVDSSGNESPRSTIVSETVAP